MKRRAFLSTTSGLLGGIGLQSSTLLHLRKDRLLEAMEQSVLRRSLFPDPIIIESVELLRYEDNFICRVRSRDGATGISIGNNMQLRSLWPIQVLRVQPFFVGKDARDLDALIEGVYTFMSNYKLQSLALWVPVATVEFAVLDLLGKIAGLPMGMLLNERRHHDRIAVYRANNHRGKSAEYSLEKIQETVAQTGAKALKFKVAGRMDDEDLPRGRSETLIPAVREAFGPNMTIYADANGGYDVKEAIRIGRLMQEYNYDFFEEPIAFDRYQDLKMSPKNCAYPLPMESSKEASIISFGCWVKMH
jgi:L-alanine-DL-glutamate epimerase-like enolase superfamily enzyme